MRDKHLPEFWQAVKPGDILTLSDIRTIEVGRKAGQGIGGLDYTVKKATRLKEVRGLAEWRLLELSCQYDKRELHLIAKIVDQDLSLGAMEPLGLEPGTRKELLDREMLFLFKEPDDPDGFNPADLSYAVELLSEETGFCWFLKPQGELAAEVASIPTEAGTEDLLATIAEYGSRKWRGQDDEWIDKEEPEEPDEVYIIEKGQDENSYVEFFGVWMLGPADVGVLRK